MVYDIGAIVIGFVLLVWGADRFVIGAGATARNLGVAPILIGLTIVAFATSAPEILVSVVASMQGTPALAVGNAVGSNIANIGLVLGAAAILRPMEVRSQTLRRELPALLVVTLFAFMLCSDQNLSRTDGMVLLVGLALLMYWIVALAFRSSASDPMGADYAAEIPSDMTMARALTWLAIGLGVLLVGSNLLVNGAVAIAESLGVSDLIIGLTIVAIGTSLPELAVTTVSAVKGEHGLAVGNIIGSNMFNLLAVMGLAAAIAPSDLDPQVLSFHLPVMVGLTMVLFVMAYSFGGQGRINRWEGAALLMTFFAYHGYIASTALIP
jgi:cation:H+ antiporter